MYRNDGNGTFTDVSAESGVAAFRGNGLGVVIADYDDDGWPEVFVANDSMPNFLFRRTGHPEALGQWRFEEVALRAGVAVASDGRARAGMGTDAGDYDGDGISTWSSPISIPRCTACIEASGVSCSRTRPPRAASDPRRCPLSALASSSLTSTTTCSSTWRSPTGTSSTTLLLRRAGSTYGQRNQLFRNIAPRRFADVTAAAGPGFALEKVSRGLAAGDIDNDGDLDLLVTNNGQTADLLRNDGDHGNALVVRLVGKQSNRDGIGARLRVTTGTRTQMREVKAGSSYLGQNDLRQHVGLGASETVDRLEVKWPSGRVRRRARPPGQSDRHHPRRRRRGRPSALRAPSTSLGAP